jgi:hypothetical protein
MGYLAEIAKKRAEKREKTSRSHDEYLATLGNDETSADELRLVLKWAALPIFFFWVAYVGYIHLSKELIGVVPDEHVFALAIGIPLVFQAIKAYCATKCLRAFHFKWYDESAQDFWIYSLLGLLTVLAFVWTLKISFWDVKETANSNYVENNTIPLDAHLKTATADIDAQIARLDAKEQETGPLKNKRGRTNWGAQPIITENAKSRASLDAQRQTIIDAATKEFTTRTATVEKQAQSRGNFFQRFGGVGELLEVLCFILIGLLEAKLHRLNSQKEHRSPRFNAEEIKGQAPPHPNGKQQPIHNQAPTDRQPMGFRWPGYGQANPSPTDALDQQPLFPKTVAQSPIAVAQPQEGNYADAVLELCRQSIQKEMANFRNTQALKSSVSRRICEHLDVAYAAMTGNAFAPSYPIGLRIYSYLQDDVFPILNGVGHPYTREKFFLPLLYQKFAPQQPA